MNHVMKKKKFLPYANNKGADQLAQSDQHFWFRYLDSFYTQNFKTLASLCSWAGRFESYLVADPEDRFSRDEAHLYVGYRCEERWRVCWIYWVHW